MEFFENAVNKARDVLDAAYKKTEEVVSVQKQKYDIASMKSKLNKDFEAFGRACLDFVSNDGEVTSEAKFLASEILRKQAEIDAAQAELDKTQGKKLLGHQFITINNLFIFLLQERRLLLLLQMQNK